MIEVMTVDGALGHADGSLVSGGVFTITSTPSVKVRAVGGGVYRGPLLYTFAGGDADGFDPGTVATTAPQQIDPTAVKVRADGLEVIRLGDSGEMAATGTVSGTPTPIIGLVEVADAGQSKVRAN
jgi:hypothetical protein